MILLCSHLSRQVFASLMIVVSPFETTDSDVSWEAVHEWVRQLQGVDSFLDNLRHFSSSTVPPPKVQSTLDFMANAELFPATVKKFSGALATLCTWIWSVCEASQPQLTQSYRQQQKGYQGPSDPQQFIEEEVETRQVVAEEVDYGFVKGEQIGSPRKMDSSVDGNAT